MMQFPLTHLAVTALREQNKKTAWQLVGTEAFILFFLNKFLYKVKLIRGRKEKDKMENNCKNAFTVQSFIPSWTPADPNM